jgi:hypothetical protein
MGKIIDDLDLKWDPNSTEMVESRDIPRITRKRYFIKGRLRGGRTLAVPERLLEIGASERDIQVYELGCAQPES